MLPYMLTEHSYPQIHSKSKCVYLISNKRYLDDYQYASFFPFLFFPFTFSLFPFPMFLRGPKSPVQSALLCSAALLPKWTTMYPTPTPSPLFTPYINVRIVFEGIWIWVGLFVKLARDDQWSDNLGGRV